MLRLLAVDGSRTVYQCDECGMLAVDDDGFDREIVVDGASFGELPECYPCDNGCDDEDD